MVTNDNLLKKIEILIRVQTDLIRVQTDLVQGQNDLVQGQTDLVQGQNDLVSSVKALQQGQINLEQRQTNLEQGQKQLREELIAKIDASQKDTIDTLTALIHTGYNLHEKRITRLERHTRINSS